jgi:hypothetical protein
MFDLDRLADLDAGLAMLERNAHRTDTRPATAPIPAHCPFASLAPVQAARCPFADVEVAA